MQPKPYDPRRHDVAGWFVCEYVHGTMAFWDGGLSRGQQISTIPWAKAPTEKAIITKATGMWSSELTPLKVGDKFTNSLPSMPLVGILHNTVDTLNFSVTGCPALKEILRDGVVHKSNATKMFSTTQNLRWLSVRKQHKVPDLLEIQDNATFEDELWFLDYHLVTYGQSAHLLLHKKLPTKDVNLNLRNTLTKYPNGFLLRAPDSVWSSTIGDNYLRLLP